MSMAAISQQQQQQRKVFAGTTSSEGYDRQDLNLDDNLDALISAVAAAQPNTVAVLSVPGAIVMPWSEVGCSAVVYGTAFVNCF